MFRRGSGLCLIELCPNSLNQNELVALTSLPVKETRSDHLATREQVKIFLGERWNRWS